MILEEFITKDKLYSSISQEEIFRRYIPNFKSVGVKFCSNLRDDPNPSCIITPYNGVLWYKDFGTNSRGVDAIGYVSMIYSITYNQAIEKIADNLGYSPQIRVESIPKNEVKTKYEFKVRNYLDRDKEYWGSYSISEEDLKSFDIYPIDWLRVIKDKVTVIREAFAYVYILDKNVYKFLFPYSDYKWLSNCDSNTFQGYNQLPWTGELLIITKSLKDVVVLHKLGYNAIAPNSESQVISKQFMSLLKRRFKRIVLFYDNDIAGIAGANKNSTLHCIDNIMIPIELNVKDISDYTKLNGLEKSKILLEQLLNLILFSNESNCIQH